MVTDGVVLSAGYKITWRRTEKMHNPNTYEIFVIIWFVVSGVIAVLGTPIFWLWLLRRGAGPSFFWAGTPGYLEYVYVKWCRTQGRPPNKAIIIFRCSTTIIYSGQRQ